MPPPRYPLPRAGRRALGRHGSAGPPVDMAPSGRSRPRAIGGCHAMHRRPTPSPTPSSPPPPASGTSAARPPRLPPMGCRPLETWPRPSRRRCRRIDRRREQFDGRSSACTPLPFVLDPQATPGWKLVSTGGRRCRGWPTQQIVGRSRSPSRQRVVDEDAMLAWRGGDGQLGGIERSSASRARA